jgi:hypothetical protein
MQIAPINAAFSAANRWWRANTKEVGRVNEGMANIRKRAFFFVGCGKRILEGEQTFKAEMARVF